LKVKFGRKNQNIGRIYLVMMRMETLNLKI